MKIIPKHKMEGVMNIRVGQVLIDHLDELALKYNTTRSDLARQLMENGVAQLRGSADE